MKKYFIGFLMVIGVILLTFIGNGTYKVNAKIIDKKAHKILIEDSTGEVWDYYDDFDTFEIGQEIILTLDDHNSDIKEDDIVKKIELLQNF